MAQFIVSNSSILGLAFSLVFGTSMSAMIWYEFIYLFEKSSRFVKNSFVISPFTEIKSPHTFL